MRIRPRHRRPVHRHQEAFGLAGAEPRCRKHPRRLVRNPVRRTTARTRRQKPAGPRDPRHRPAPRYGRRRAWRLRRLATQRGQRIPQQIALHHAGPDLGGNPHSRTQIRQPPRLLRPHQCLQPRRLRRIGDVERVRGPAPPARRSAAARRHAAPPPGAQAKTGASRLRRAIPRRRRAVCRSHRHNNPAAGTVRPTPRPRSAPEAAATAPGPAAAARTAPARLSASRVAASRRGPRRCSASSACAESVPVRRRPEHVAHRGEQQVWLPLVPRQRQQEIQCVARRPPRRAPAPHTARTGPRPPPPRSGR